MSHGSLEPDSLLAVVSASKACAGQSWDCPNSQDMFWVFGSGGAVSWSYVNGSRTHGDQSGTGEPHGATYASPNPTAWSVKMPTPPNRTDPWSFTWRVAVAEGIALTSTDARSITYSCSLR